MSLTLLFLAANPTDTARLRVDQECRLIGKALRSAEYRDQFRLENHGAVHVEDLQELFLLHRPQIVHFSGHGSAGGEIVLEDKNGSSQAVPVDALSRLFAILKGNIRCVVLNACATEAQAQAIAQHIDCVIGMSQAISDDASIVFATAFYQALGYGESVQKAFELGCNEIDLNHLGEQNTPRLIALNADPAGIILTDPPQPPNALPSIDIIDLPTRPETFQGRLTEIQTLARYLSGDTRPRLITLYGAPGQGKTTLARQAVERFAPSWPGGILAISFENLPTRQDLVARLAEFLNIEATQLPPDQAERRVLQTLARRPATLLVLDNAETLVDQLDANAAPAAALAEFLQDRISPTVTLFVTSRRRLGLPGEQTLELPGLTPPEGARLFQQSAPDQPATPADLARLEALSAQLEGHPLSLRLLGIAYNNFGPDLPAFLRQFEAQLVAANDKYKSLDHRQRTLFACIETSIQPLDPELKNLFYNLSLFHAPFKADTAAAIFDPESDESQTEEAASSLTPFVLPSGSAKREGGQGGILLFSAHLYHLWQRGLLERQTYPSEQPPLELYHLLPPLRLYAEQTAPLPQILPRFALIYGRLIRWIYAEIKKGPTASFLARLSAPDLERALEHTQDAACGWYNFYLGSVEFHLGRPREGKPHLEQALDWARDHNQQLASSALNELGMIYNATSQPQEALKYYHEALPIFQEVGDRTGVAATLNNIGGVYRAIGQPQEALKYFREALSIRQEVGDRAGEASALNNIGLVYDNIGQPQEALKYYREALPIRQEVGDRSGEAATLNNIGLVYDNIGQPQEALKYYREALLISQEVGNRAGEAVTLTNIGEVYRTIGQPQEALKYFREALPIRQEVGDRSGEATTLNNMALLLFNEGKNQKALDLVRQILSIYQQMGAAAGEATTLYALALILGTRMNDPVQALPLLHRSIELLKTNHLPQDNAGATLADHEALLAELEKRVEGISNPGIEPELIANVINSLRGHPLEKISFAQKLSGLLDTPDPLRKNFINRLISALFGGNLAQLAIGLQGQYAEAWAQIMAGVNPDSNH